MQGINYLVIAFPMKTRIQNQLRSTVQEGVNDNTNSTEN